ncbi:hypothetical protein IX53_01960 [Kosmotoga pacifica]|uniref:Uncharacterized protein n=2 Tax=Kosmotoga pacifica TaxID=1330330 RepID=A0A0G2Z5E1_9BACT|nr:hypothetical protein IX53_01960 [Kosmotoga pacifica]
MILALVELVLFFPFMNEDVLGILYGTAFSITGWWLMVKDVKVLEKRGALFRFGFLLRYFLYAIGLGTAMIYGKVFFFGAVLGLLNLKFSLFIFGRWLSENTAH